MAPPNSHGALLLVQDTNSGSTEESPNLVLHKDNVAIILNQVGSRPLSIISIVGPKKTGKSLVFSYIVKYLSTVENDFEWIDWNDKITPLDEFPLTLSGPAGTHGVWCYNRAFDMKTENDEKVAVLLLYIQCPDKWKWSSHATTTALTGLGILASTTVILNVTKQIDEMFMTAVPAFISKALSDLKRQQSQPPFKNATILVRDWSFPSDFPFGTSGGRQYLKVEKLQGKLAHSKESRTNRQVLGACFETLSGCLLPFPGNDVIKANFTGSIGQTDLLFLETLKEFIEEVIDVDNLPLIYNSAGETMSGQEWESLLKDYVRKVNDDGTEDVDTKKLMKTLGLKRKIIPGEEKQLMREAVVVYQKAISKKMRESMKTQNFLSPKALDKFHKDAVKKALKYIEKEMIPPFDGDDEDVDDSGRGHMEREFTKAGKSFKQKLNEKYEALKAEQAELKTKFVEDCKRKLIAEFNESILAEFPKERKLPSEATVRNKCKEYKTDTEDQFEKQIREISSSENIPIDIIQNFKHQMSDIVAKLIDDLLGKNGSQKKEVSQRQFAGEYPNKRTAVFANHSDNEHEHDQMLRSVDMTKASDKMKFVESRSTFLTKDVKPTEEKNVSVENIVPSHGMATRQKTKMQEEQNSQKTKQLIARLKNNHVTNLNDHVENETELETYHSQQVKLILKSFDQECPYEQDSQLFLLNKVLLEDELKAVIFSAKSKIKQINRKNQSTLNKAIKEAVSSYEAQMEMELLNFGKNVTELNRIHSSLLTHELEILQKNLKKQDYDRAKAEVTEKTEAILTLRKSQKQREGEISGHVGKQLLTTLKTEYSLMMNSALKDAKKGNKFTLEHEKVKAKVLDRFAELSAGKDSSSLEKDKSELENSILQAYSDFKKALQNKQDCEAGNIKLAAKEAQAFYKESMRKHLQNHEFILEPELVNLHKNVSKEATNKCLPGLEKSQKQEFEETLEIIFQQYKDENNMNLSVEPAIGIDLGTTFSCVAVYEKGKVKIIPNSVGKLTTPSYVLFQPDGEEIVGVAAKERAYENPEGAIFDAKRILGRKFDDPKLQDDMKLWPFSVIDDGCGVPMIEVNGERYHPEMISAKILTQLKKDAEQYLKRKVTKAVITVPAYFTDGQKQATVDAGKMAGLEVLSILTEPVAAAMAYKLQYSTDDKNSDRHILIFDLGGGTFDVAVLKTSLGNVEVLTVNGDTHLGGEDFDQNMMRYCAAEFKKSENVDLFEGKDSPDKIVRDDVRRRLKRLQGECERQKISLASSRLADVSLSCIYKEKNLKVSVSRQTFETINKTLFEKTIRVVEDALKSAKLQKNQIDDIVMVGGSTRIPKIQSMLRDFFDGKELDKKINPDEAVAHGAGLLAAQKKGNISLDSTEFTKIQDVTPMPIGVEIYGGGFSPIIPKNTKTPVMLKERYKTAHNNQTSVQITIYEGEDQVAVKNKHLGDFYLNGIPPKGAGVENIDVEMVINDQGILHVSAKCSSSGATSAVTVTENKQRLGQATIKRYLADRVPGKK